MIAIISVTFTKKSKLTSPFLYGLSYICSANIPLAPVAPILFNHPDWFVFSENVYNEPEE